MRICSTCGIQKQPEMFSKNKSSPDGLKSICKECTNKKRAEGYVSRYNRPKGMTRDELVLYKRKWNAANKDRLKHYRLKAKYSISIEEYNEQCLKQNNLCACCSKPVPILYVDHCHITGSVRGLICQQCNAGIGLLGDTLEGVLNAVEYLQKDCDLGEVK